ncbi:ER lumen protein-retaining receptor-like [Gossypium australe]|uniref:ER lumen protein-retaining receptor-like n=1 Tax=Gossypium australe TaxID=47621 RepID=A0A5B6U4G7_9ROSI|nr:ER lumen protein-retaining receptor-like [Gossypium australe]
MMVTNFLMSNSWLWTNIVPCYCSAYRALYIVNWIYRYSTEDHFVHWITWICGLVQTLLYADFFYYYFQSWKNNMKLQLPA